MRVLWLIPWVIIFTKTLSTRKWTLFAPNSLVKKCHLSSPTKLFKYFRTQPSLHKIFIKQKFEILFTAYLSKQRLRNNDRPMKEVDAGGRRQEKNAKE